MQQRGVITLKEKPISASVWCGMFSGKLPKEHKHESYVVNGEIVKREEVSISKAAELAGLNIEEMKRVLLLFLFSKPIATSLFNDNLTIARILPLSITDYRLRITDHASRDMSHMKHKTVCVVGLGYVGLPLAEAFSKHLKVIGFDIDEEKTRNLGNNNRNNKENIEFTTDPSKIEHADFVIIAVPTPVTKSNLRRQTYRM